MTLVGFTEAIITATEKGPSLPDAVVQSVTPQAATEATGNRPSLRVVIDFPIPEDNETQYNKAKTRATYGLGRGMDLPLKDSDGTRLQFSAQLFAQKEKPEDNSTTDKDVTEE